jgi:hypothetical protein
MSPGAQGMLADRVLLSDARSSSPIGIRRHGAGLLLITVAVLWALSGPRGDANIGAGLMSLAGASLVCFGVAWLVWAIQRLRH